MPLKPCSLCGSSAESDWTIICEDETWCSHWVGCTDDHCDTMLSMEFHDFDHSKRKQIEVIMKRAWNEIHEA